MLGAVQLGVLAACIVLFVPMGMAGWHLSRNKMLFFSGALFITLAVGVHLTPYFPSISGFMSSISSSAAVYKNRDSCISFVHDIIFNFSYDNVSDKVDIFNENINYRNDSDVFVSWDWVKSGPLALCAFQRLSQSDASDLLNGSWVVVAGDSQARLFVVKLLNLVLGDEEMESIRGDLFKRHSNYQLLVTQIGMKLDFIWAPYVKNLTDLVVDLKLKKNYPDVFVMGAGLWDMLHVTNSLFYGRSLLSLRDSLVSLLPVSTEFGTNGPVAGTVSIRSPHLFWLSMPMLINTMLNTEEKREKMNDAMQVAYDRELYGSKLLRQSAGPLLLLDVEALSQKCGSRCTLDGMHYRGAVYEAAVHIMLNSLLIESHQKLR